jgi:D-glycero-D-manno-heptose 1,7-bisphosphate phosphatase
MAMEEQRPRSAVRRSMTDSIGASRTPALFLDRDGVVNVDRGYVHRIEDVEFIPGIFDVARFFVLELTWPIIVLTNQSGIGRGYFDERAYQVLTDWMCDRFRREAAPIARVYHCPFHPEHGLGIYKAEHEWRKPKPGMFLQAAADLSLDLSSSVSVGDKPADVVAAAAAGVPLRIRLDREHRPDDPSLPSSIVVRDLGEALTYLKQTCGSLRNQPTRAR